MSSVRRRDQGTGKEGGENDRKVMSDDFENRDTEFYEGPPQRALVKTARPRLFEGPSAGNDLPAGMLSSDQLESFRELRTRLTLTAADSGLRHFTTLVVPVAGGSGASFVARNLAAAFTLQEGTIAVLVDCDFRNPTQHAVMMERPADEGLSDYLEWPYTPAERPMAVRRVTLPTAIPGLHLIPAGRCEAIRAGRPREYFTSSAMKLLMSDLRAEPCFVVLDGPAVTGSPDARILSDFADLVVLVVGYGRSTPAAIAEAAALFDAKKLAGIVFNEGRASSAPSHARRGRRP